MQVSQLDQFLYQSLYDAAYTLLAMQPWETLADEDVFAVQNPDDGEMHFAKITGREGDQCELTIFSGIKGLDLLWALNNAPAAVHVKDLCCDVPGLCFAAVPWGMLDKTDRELVSGLALPVGVGCYPVFRSLRPGYYPARLSISELCLLTHVLRQTAVLVAALQDASLSLAMETGHEDDYIARLATKTAQGQIDWRTERVRLNLDELLPLREPACDQAQLAQLKAKPMGEQELRLDLLLVPPAAAAIMGDQPLPATYVFLISDHHTQDALCAQIAAPGESLPAFRQDLPGLLVEMLRRLPARPRCVQMELYSLADGVRGLLAELGIALELQVLPPESEQEQSAVLSQLAAQEMTLPATLWF